MAFTNPLVLWLLALLPLLWLRRAVPRTRVPVAALHLWQAAVPDHASATPRRLRADLITALRTVAAGSLIIALAGPMLPLPGQRVAIVVDASASMGARDGNARRIDAAKTRASSLIDELPMLAEVDVIAAARVPSVVGTYRASDPRLAQAISRLEPGAEEADLDASFGRATASGATHTFIVTDQPPPTELNRATMTWAQVGQPEENVAIAALAYARRAIDPAPQVLISLMNFGERRATRELVLSLPAATPLREQLSLQPGERLTLVRPITGTGRVTAALDGTDALAADDSRTLDIRPPVTRRVQLRNAGPALERAVRALPDVTIADDNAVVIVCGQCDAVPQGANVLLVPPAGEAANTEPLSLTASAHPVGASISLEGIRVVPVAAPDAATAGTAIAVAGGTPVVIASDVDGRRVVELRMNLTAGTLTLDPAFPILVANAVEWLAPAATEGSAGGVPIGESDLLATSRATVISQAPAVDGRVAANATVLFAIVALMAVAGEWFVTARRRTGARPAIWPRAAAIGVLALAIAGVRIPGALAPVTAVAVIDRSASMGSAAPALDRLALLGGGRRDDDRLGVVVFGATAGIERRPATVAALPTITSTIERGGTDIEAGLRAARTSLPSTGTRRLVLISDGRQTGGDALREAERAAQEGIRIDVVRPEWLSAERRPLTVTRLTAPSKVLAGEPFQVVATVEGPAGVRGEFVMRRDGTPVSSVPIVIPAAGVTTVTLNERQTAAGAYEYQAVLSRPEDDFGVDTADAASAGAVVVVTGTPRLLHVGARSIDLNRLLLPAGFRTDTLDPASMPRTVSALASYDVIVLDDVAGDEIDVTQGAALAGYVEQAGGGLLILGSPRSLEPGLGGQAALSAVAPVDFRPRGGQRAPSASVVVVFDKSGSMADLVDGAPKIEYARQAVESVMQAVSPADLVGVIAFDATAVPVVPLQAGHTPESVRSRLRSTTPAGPTAIAPALELARSWLQAAPARDTARRHILLVSDGRTSAADAERSLAVASTRGIAISTVALDAASDRELLTTIAERSSGRAYFPADARALPRLLAREATRVAGGQIVEEASTARVARHAVTTGIAEGPGPELGGYVVGAVKPQAEIALASSLGDPILATARAGLGRVGIYTADLRSTWSADLRAWRQFPTLLTQTVRWVSRRTSTEGLFAAIHSTDAGMRLTVETDDLRVVEARVDVRGPGSDRSRTLTLEPIVPGRFEGFIEAAAPGAYLFSITGTGAAIDARLVRGHVWTAQREFSSTGPDMALLASLARATGGRILDGSDTAFSGPRERTWRLATTWFITAALVIVLALWLSPVAADLRRRLAAKRRPSLTPSAGTA